MSKEERGNTGNMWTPDQERFFNDQFEIMTFKIIDAVSKKQSECENNRCCKSIDFNLVVKSKELEALQKELVITNPKNLKIIIALILLVLLVVDIAGGIKEFVRKRGIDSGIISYR
jgi:hypothetical protein